MVVEILERPLEKQGKNLCYHTASACAKWATVTFVINNVHQKKKKAKVHKFGTQVQESLLNS